ncbi:MAG: cation diffusion facilitator family transporter [Candidatus Bipolaricaulaceae bacterium]
MYSRERRLLWAIGVGFFVFLGQVIVGLFTRSLALLADSAHVFLDVFALVLAYVGARFARWPPTPRYTYGFRRVEVLIAAVNGLTLVLLMTGVVREAIGRLGAPREVGAGPMLAMAGAGLGANLLMAVLLHRHEPEDLNLQAAFLHVVGDALGSVAVITSGLVILFTGWTLVDPLAGLLIAGIVGVGAARVLRRSWHILAEGAPEGLHTEKILQRMASQPGVLDVHDLHLWTIGPGFSALSAHVVVDAQSMAEADALAAALRKLLHTHFGLTHVTLQLEGSFCGAPCCNGVTKGG